MAIVLKMCVSIFLVSLSLFCLKKSHPAITVITDRDYSGKTKKKIAREYYVTKVLNDPHGVSISMLVASGGLHSSLLTV